MVHHDRTRSPLVECVLPVTFRLPTPPPPSSRPVAAPDTATASAPPDWFPPLLPSPSDLSGHRCGTHQMLTLVAYDITDPKRLHKAAKLCEDWGMRIQYSVFECRLEAQQFETFWSELSAVIEPRTDRIVAYKICTRCAREIHSAGAQVHNEKVVAYVC